MKRLAIIAALILGITAPALAETYNYACHEQDDGHLYAAKLDTGNRTLTWRGSVYKNVRDISGANVNECAKECFGDNNRIILRTATQGVATLQVLAGTGPGDDGMEEFECDLVRQK
jgi:hypothetical protein